MLKYKSQFQSQITQHKSHQTKLKKEIESTKQEKFRFQEKFLKIEAKSCELRDEIDVVKEEISRAGVDLEEMKEEHRGRMKAL